MTAAVAGALLAICAAGPAQAALYEMSWAWKWGQGRIVYDPSVPDSNPDPYQGTYIGAISSYDLSFWEILVPNHIVGNAGSIWVSAATLPCAPPWFENCERSVATYQFGTATVRDPAAWQMSLQIPDAFDAGDSLPPAPETGWESLGDWLEKPAEGIRLYAIHPMTRLHFTPVPTPVPEPATGWLVVLGRAGLAVRRRFGTFVSRRHPHRRLR